MKKYILHILRVFLLRTVHNSCTEQWNVHCGESRWRNSQKVDDKPIHGSCAIYFPGGIMEKPLKKWILTLRNSGAPDSSHQLFIHKLWFLSFQSPLPSKALHHNNVYCMTYCIYYIPGTQMTSMFEGQPPKTRPFPIKTRVIWVPGIIIIIISP